MRIHDRLLITAYRTDVHWILHSDRKSRGFVRLNPNSRGARGEKIRWADAAIRSEGRLQQTRDMCRPLTQNKNKLECVRFSRFEAPLNSMIESRMLGWG